jgi:hypothetical protein
VVQILLLLVRRSSPLSCRSVNFVNCPLLVDLSRIQQEVAEQMFLEADLSPHCSCQQFHLADRVSQQLTAPWGNSLGLTHPVPLRYSSCLLQSSLPIRDNLVMGHESSISGCLSCCKHPGS